MEKKLTMKSEEVRARALFIIENLPLTPIHEIAIREYHVNYSELQRGLYFDWCGTIGDELGYPKDQMHIELKRLFLVPIYADNKSGRHDGYGEMVNSVESIQGSNNIMDEVVKLTSITKASMKEMRLYMDRVALHAQELGIRLRFPGDGYYDDLAKRFKR